MRHKLLVMLLVVGASLVTQFQAHPQSSIPKETATPVASSASWISPPPLKLTAAVGERLDYLISWADYLIAARVQLEVKQGSTAPQREDLQLHMQAQTVGVVRSIILALDDKFISYVDPQSVLPSKFEKHLRQGQRRVDSTITFDHKAQTAQVDEKSVPIEPETRDVVALLYYIRTLDLSPGKQYKLSAIFEDKPFIVLVSPEQKAVVETAKGPVEAIEIALRSEEIQGWRKKINDDYRLRLWLSNDEKRAPVLITARPPFGEIKVRLAKPEPWA
ncbi:MAG: DUF3108 domain-containing protein [Acidobacteria bacterium]|nr:DUF3108 domain-containing protein [Acidobacteriota bacterium]